MKAHIACVIVAVTMALAGTGHCQTWGQPAPQQPAPQQPGQYGNQPAPQPYAASTGSYSSNTESYPVATDMDRAEHENSGRGLEWVWLNSEVGFEAVSLQTFKANDLVDAKFISDKSSGLVYGAGLGVRLIVFTLGARFRLGTLSDWDLWSLNLEAGFHIPLGNFEPYFTFSGGYSSIGAFSGKNIGTKINSSHVDITGYDIRLGGGLDYYVTPAFSVGAAISGDFLGLSRSGLKGLTAATSAGSGGTTQADAQKVYAADGSSLGSALAFTAVLGLHF